MVMHHIVLSNCYAVAGVIWLWVTGVKLVILYVVFKVISVYDLTRVVTNILLGLQV